MASSSPASPPPSPASSDVVHGFANHVPLAVALRQILPPGYGFSVDQNVDLSVLVSFKGGKPWRETLDDALAPADLVAHEQGQMVQIRYLAVREPVTVASSAAPNASFTPPAANTLELPPSITPASGMAPIAPVTFPPSPGATAGIPVIAASSTQQEWNAEPGDSLHKVLEEWSHRANVEFDWMAEYDYPLQASIHLKGNFENAVRELLTGFEAAHPQPIGELHSNPRVGQMVLVVTTRGNSVD